MAKGDGGEAKKKLRQMMGVGTDRNALEKKMWSQICNEERSTESKEEGGEIKTCRGRKIESKNEDKTN